MQLVSKAKEGLTIPEQLPSSLLPFKTRHLSIPSSVNNFDSKVIFKGSKLVFNLIQLKILI